MTLDASPSSPRIQRLFSDLHTTGQKALQIFWDEIAQQGSPIIEPGPGDQSLVTFLWKDNGAARSVAVIQDWGADGIREHFMTPLPGTDLWYLTRTMPSDTRTTYQLSPSPDSDSSRLAPYHPDPFNPKIFTTSLSESGPDIYFSLLELPAAPSLPWRQAGSAQAGSVQLYTPFADQRRFWVYLPSGDYTTPLPGLLFLDGRIYKDQFQLAKILDYLITSDHIPPVAALMLDNEDRRELLCRPDFNAYVAQQVMPWFRSTFPVSKEPRQSFAVGSSYGGLGVVYLAYTHPAVFGGILSQTGWFRWHPEDDPAYHWLARQIANGPKVPVRFWLQVGSLETAQMLDGGPSQRDANRFMRDTLLEKGYAVSYEEYSGGHDTTSLEYPLARAVTDMLKQARDE